MFLLSVAAVASPVDSSAAVVVVDSVFPDFKVSAFHTLSLPMTLVLSYLCTQPIT